MATSSDTSQANPSLWSYGFKCLKYTILVGFLIGAGFLTAYVLRLNYKVTSTFEAKRWDIPARIYANPLDLYVGLNLKASEFKDILLQLNYRKDSRLSFEGSYRVRSNRIELKTRNFHFWDGRQNSQKLKIQFSNKEITQISDLDTGKGIPITRMDPVKIGSFYPQRKEDRILIKLDEAPTSLTHALFATEDREFENHQGVSLRGILRAIWSNLLAGSVVQGASTITQQLVKNFYLTPERKLKRKVNEIFMALLLEYHYEKEEILEAYLNEIYLGQDGANSVHGFGLASEFYFARPLKNLPLHQVAALVALVRGPSYYDLRKHPKRALKRRNLVLNEMFKQDYIKEKALKQALKKPLEVIPHKHRSVNRYPAFLEKVKQELDEQYQEDDLTTEGLKIFTTLDSQVQNRLEATVSKKIASFEKRRRSKQLETAVLISRRENGEIIALVGGRKSTEAGFNRALKALRPIGSLIKPAIYLTALMQSDKYNITTPISDSTIVVDNNGQPWKPDNYDHKEHGLVPMHKALSQSYNLATVRLGMDVGLDAISETLKNLGVTRSIEKRPSMLLGSLSLTPFEVMQMYQTFAGDGFYTNLKTIQSVVAMDGKPLKHYPFTIEQGTDPAATYIINTMLQKVMSDGTGRSAYKYLPKEFSLAGKTGTSNELKDSWFAGFSGDYLSVVWIGRDDNKSTGLSGSSGALRLWSTLMKQIAKQPVDLIAPDNIEMAWIDKQGLLADNYCTDVKKYPFIEGSIPEKRSACIAVIKKINVHLPSVVTEVDVTETETIPDPVPVDSEQLDKDGQPIQRNPFY
ncbi:MAG: penicillin-binding protein 1B [Methylococcales bacterium]|nr:penicillin-binding protein 1B [Methylococcales bacterium]